MARHKHKESSLPYLHQNDTALLAFELGKLQMIYAEFPVDVFNSYRKDIAQRHGLSESQVDGLRTRLDDRAPGGRW